jgi:G3E family GTPase
MIPITVVTGFLGSGKTTLLSRVLTEPFMQNTAVLVNEFGEVGLDHHLLRQVDERTMLLGNGCVCCTMRGDLVDALLELFSMDERDEMPALDRVIIETTGLADPVPILYTIVNDPVLQHHFFVDLVIATVDAINGNFHLDRNPESLKQVVASDRIVVTKTDIVKPESVISLVSRLDTINPSAQIVEPTFGEVDAKQLVYGDGNPVRAVTRAGSERAGEHDGMAGTHSVSLTFDGTIDWTAFGIWLSMLLHSRGEDVLRVKGLVDAGGSGPVVLNGVQHTIHPPEHLREWPDEDHKSRIIFIMKDIRSEEIMDSLLAFKRLLGARPLTLAET